MENYKIYLDSAHTECKPNLVLLSKAQIYLEKNGHIIVNDPLIAQFIIVSTCGFTASKETNSVNLFNKHKKNSKVKILSIGCLNKINKELLTSCSQVQMVSNLSDLDGLFYQKVKFSDVPDAYIDERMNIKPSAYQPSFRILTSTLYHLLKKSDLYRKMLCHVYRKDKVFVEIGTGCVSNCSYCIVKKAKGNPVSRSSEDILNDINKVYQPGKELYLVADDCGSYGVDIGTNLPTLLWQIGKKYQDLPIDISYLNPLWLTKYEEEYINILRDLKINSVNLTMQSGSNKIIRGMNRKYDVNEILNILKKLRSVSPSTAFWTHVIVGFPGETLNDFRRTLSMMKNFDAVGVNYYSDRKGTKSVEFENRNPKFVKYIKYYIALSFAQISSFSKIIKDILVKDES